MIYVNDLEDTPFVSRTRATAQSIRNSASGRSSSVAHRENRNERPSMYARSAVRETTVFTELTASMERHT